MCNFLSRRIPAPFVFPQRLVSRFTPKSLAVVVGFLRCLINNAVLMPFIKREMREGLREGETRPTDFKTMPQFSRIFVKLWQTNIVRFNSKQRTISIIKIKLYNSNLIKYYHNKNFHWRVVFWETNWNIY